MRGVVVGDPVTERGTAVGRRKPLGGAEQVLDGERHAAQRTLVAGTHQVGFGQRTLRTDEDERVDRRIDVLDRLKRSSDQLTRRELARAHECRLVSRARAERVCPQSSNILPHSSHAVHERSVNGEVFEPLGLR